MFDFLIGNDLLSALLAFAIVLIPAVIVHELGHFLAARSVGITVLEFGIGFPPRVAKMFTWRETEFTLNLIPLGGFVRPLGEDMVRPLGEEETQKQRETLGVAGEDSSASTEDNQHPNHGAENKYVSERDELAQRGVTNVKAVHEVKPLPRIFFMAAGALANFLFAFFVFFLVGLIGLPEQVGVRVGFADVAPGTPVEELGFERGDFIELINGDYFDSSDDLIARLAALEGQTAELQIRRSEAEPHEIFMQEYTITPELVRLLDSAVPAVVITEVFEDTAGEVAGLMPDDLIFTFDGEPLDNLENPTDSLVARVNLAGTTEVTLGIVRDGEQLDVTLTPRRDGEDGPVRIGIGIQGIYTNVDETVNFVVGDQSITVPQPASVSLDYAADRMASIFGLIANFPSRLFSGDTAPEERRVVSVVGVSQIGAEILQTSIQEAEPSPFLDYVGLISIALGFTNLLPIPALDGGRILFALVELIRGKPIPPEREGMVHLVGMILILSLGVFVIINDLVNPLTLVP